MIADSLTERSRGALAGYQLRSGRITGNPVANSPECLKGQLFGIEPRRVRDRKFRGQKFRGRSWHLHESEPPLRLSVVLFSQSVRMSTKSHEILATPKA